MADSAKREKIAAARKKLKQFQKSGKNSPKSRGPKSSRTEGDNLVSNKELTRIDVINATGINSESVADLLVVNSVLEADITCNSEPGLVVTSNQVIEEPKEEVTVLDNKLPEEKELVTQPIYPQAFVSPNTDPQYRPTASTESLQQLSRQINGILAESPVAFETEEVHSDSIRELETRNRELAALLAQQSQANEQLVTQAEQIRQHAIGLQSQLEKERNETNAKLTKEVGPLKEQLQVHIQTIGILVAEKTELQSQLEQSQKISEHRLGEVEDLTGRVKASRQRIGDLERSLSTSNTSSQKFEQTSKEGAKEIDKLKLDLYKLTKTHEELKQHSSEAQEKLKAKTTECSTLQQSVEDLQSRLEMAELYAQQLSSQNEEGKETLQVVAQLQQERDGLAGQVQQFAEHLRKAQSEKDEMTHQYQQYIEQLQHQNQQMTAQISSLTDEREKMVNRQHELEAAVIELQRKIEDIDATKSAVDETAHQELVQELHKVQTEYEDLQQRHESQIRDNTQLSRFLEEKESHITELEGQLAEMGEMEGDKAELLENIQSDKTALSRALTQNKDLKTQLAELQNGFVKLSNDNMELLTQLQTEEHSMKDLLTKLAQQEDELKDVREALSSKDLELTEAIKNSVEANKVKLLHEQIQDRLRHYEAQAQLVETLSKELHSSQDMVEALTTQNSELRAMLIKATETRAYNPDSSVESAQREDVIDSLQSTIQQLESERSQLHENLRQQRELADHLSVRVSDQQEEIVQLNSSSNTDNDKVTRREYDQLKRALDLIEDKYTRVMRDKADLSDKADQLEHIVLQLQGETDTIGEYISLYHHQRALLQQRENHKNEYISQLAKDREELQDKLGELQALVMQLMGEKNMLHSYAQESRRPVSPIYDPYAAQSQHLVNGKSNEWPDYTSSESDTESEVETIVGGKDDTLHPDHLPDNEAGHDADENQSQHSNMETQEHHHKKTHKHTHSQSSGRSRTHSSSHSDIQGQGHIPIQGQGHTPLTSATGEQTAHKILNLLNELGHSNLVDKSATIEEQFHPCKYCKGRLQVL